MTSLLTLASAAPQSALDPAGPYAGAIARLWWIFFITLSAIYVVVALFILTATFRRRASGESSDRRLTIAVSSAVGVTVTILFAFLFFSTSTGNALTSTNGKAPLKITVKAQQWWWSVQYEGADASRMITTANEIYLPVGRPAEVKLKSNDVIHSLWIPNLQGKRDLIPGHDSSFFIQADRAGKWEGQCAEFCGLQHAKMRLDVTAIPEAEFAKWVDAQLKPAVSPKSKDEQRGQQVFLSEGCPLCHAIGGTDAGGRSGPDLTHVASRRTLAAGAIPNTRGHLAGWILDPQGVKPGTNMPTNPLPPDDLNALLAYLRSLK